MTTTRHTGMSMLLLLCLKKLYPQDFQLLRTTATEAAMEQRQQRDLLQEYNNRLAREEEKTMGAGILIIAVLLLLFFLFLLLRVRFDTRLHTARFSRRTELRHLLTNKFRTDGLFLGKLPFPQRFVSVAPRPERQELGNLLIVAPTRSGKGLLATSQLLSWKHSVIINDIKGELFAATAGYRKTLGDVFVIDPTGVGHRYDPLVGKQTEDEFYSSASHLLFTPDEGEGAIFTQRATGMLTQIFVAARREGIAPLPYARLLLRSGLKACAERLNNIDPQLATQFLDISYEEMNLNDRFLLSAWGTLTARTRPLLTETVIRCFTHADVTAKNYFMFRQTSKRVSSLAGARSIGAFSIGPALMGKLH